MNYIYDIALNFQKYYCEFFEWKKEDKIFNIRRIPMYRVSSEDLEYFKYYNVIVDKEFFDKVKGDLGNTKKIMCLVSDGSRGLGLLFHSSGKIIKRSSMLYDEEDEVCGYALEFEPTNICYEKKKEIPKEYELRFFRQRRKILLDYLNQINNDVMWKYLYYECYGCDEESLDKIKKTLYDIVYKGYSVMNQKLYQCVMDISKILN